MRVAAVAATIVVAVLAGTYATWFYWEFGALPVVAGSAPPRIRWCDGGETFTSIGRTQSAASLPAGAVWQSLPLPEPYSFRATPPRPAGPNSGLACPMRIYLQAGGGQFIAYDRAGGP